MGVSLGKLAAACCAAARAAAPAPGARVCFAASMTMPRLFSASMEAGDSSLSANGGISFVQRPFALLISAHTSAARVSRDAPDGEKLKIGGKGRPFGSLTDGSRSSSKNGCAQA